MTPLRIILDGDDGTLKEELQGRTIERTTLKTITGLAGGMSVGSPSVGLFMELEDGRVIFAETSLALLQGAVRALVARHGDQLG